MESYLLNRKQYVEIDDSDSDMLILTTGVPQGSIFGPLLFIIYMNDIAHASKPFDLLYIQMILPSPLPLKYLLKLLQTYL